MKTNKMFEVNGQFYNVSQKRKVSEHLNLVFPFGAIVASRTNVLGFIRNPTNEVRLNCSDFLVVRVFLLIGSNHFL